MKKLILAALILVAGTGVYAQNAFFAVRKGMVMTYAENDAKGKPTAYSVMTIKDVKGSGRNMTITYGIEILDKNRKPLKESPGEVVIRDGVVIMDLDQYVPAELSQAGVKIEVTGDPPEIPANMRPGQKIKDAEMSVVVDFGFFKITSGTKFTDQECLAIEDMAVPAGTFRCYKLTQTITVTSGKKSQVTKKLSWNAPDVGEIRTETYDAKNKLTGSTVLVELNGFTIPDTQNIFFAAKKGMVMTYAENDAKGKPTGYSVLTIKDVRGSGRNMTITCGVEVLDKNRQPLENSPGEVTYVVVIKDGTVIMDKNQYIPSNRGEAVVNAEVTGDPPEIPGNLRPGIKLSDTEISVTVNTSSTKETTGTKFTNQECLAIEDIKVPAGTFRGHKLTQTVTVTVPTNKKPQVSKIVSWNAPDIGVIRAETYDAKNKLTGSTVLVELKGN